MALVNSIGPYRTDSAFITPLARLKRRIRWLLRCRNYRQVSTNVHFDDAFRMLSALPLPTDTFGWARNVLQNAQTYIQAGEWGAARWELTFLLRRVPKECQNFI